MSFSPNTEVSGDCVSRVDNCGIENWDWGNLEWTGVDGVKMRLCRFLFDRGERLDSSDKIPENLLREFVETINDPKLYGLK